MCRQIPNISQWGHALKYVNALTAFQDLHVTLPIHVQGRTVQEWTLKLLSTDPNVDIRKTLHNDLKTTYGYNFRSKKPKHE